MKKIINLTLNLQLKNEVKYFNIFGNIAECLKTKVSVRMEWQEDFVLGSEIVGGRGRLKWINK